MSNGEKIMFPVVSDAVDKALEKEFNATIEEKINSINTMIKRIKECKGNHALGNALLNLCWAEGAVKSIIDLNIASQGIGSVTLRRFKHGKNECAESKINYVSQEKNADGKVILTSKFTKETSKAESLAINWDEINGYNRNS